MTDSMNNLLPKGSYYEGFFFLFFFFFDIIIQNSPRFRENPSQEIAILELSPLRVLYLGLHVTYMGLH